MAPAIDGAFGLGIRRGSKLALNLKPQLSSFVGEADKAVAAAEAGHEPDSFDPLPTGGDCGTQYRAARGPAPLTVYSAFLVACIIGGVCAHFIPLADFVFSPRGGAPALQLPHPRSHSRA